MLFCANHIRLEPDRFANVIPGVVEMKIDFLLRNKVLKRVDVFCKRE